MEMIRVAGLCAAFVIVLGVTVALMTATNQPNTTYIGVELVGDGR
jgi:hypothetical protein